MSSRGGAPLRKSIWYVAWGLLLAGFIEPAWQWAYWAFLDGVKSNPGWIVALISRGLGVLAPIAPYLIGIGGGLLLAALWGAYSPSARAAVAVPSESSSRRKGPDLSMLGERAVILADRIGQWLHNPFLHNDYASYTSQIYAVILDFSKSGLRVPPIPGSMAVDAKMELARRYFLVVGHLLVAGHISEAQAAADRFYNETVTEGSNGLPRALQGFESEILH